MPASPFDAIPEAFRDAARAATDQVVQRRTIERIAPLSGGASGALAYRVDAGDERFVLRIETSRDIFRDPERTYPCLLAAADAGIAPRVHVADAAAGVVVMDHVETRPLAEHPGGPAAIALDVARLLRRLQAATTPFPPMLGDFGALLSAMLGYVRSARRFGPGALDRHDEGLETIRRAYPWDRWPAVSSHNDLSPMNLLFDGERIWLVDWELAFRNDAFADAACLTNWLQLPAPATAPMLAALLDAPADGVAQARFVVQRALHRLFVACLLASADSEATLSHATTHLRAFADALDAPDLQQSLRVVADD